MTYQYPRCYHDAINHLISFGGHGGNRKKGRKAIALALRWLRSKDRGWAKRERLHMLFISGQFPVK